MTDKIENKIENLHLQECSLKIGSLKIVWKLVVLLEAAFFNVTFSFLYTFYIQFYGGMREITSMPVYFVSYCVLYYEHDEETLDSLIPRLYLPY